MQKIAVYINHPSQHYLFKNLLSLLKQKSYYTKIFIKEKDILEKLLVNDNVDYQLLMRNKRSNSIFDLIKNVFKKNKELYFALKEYKPDLLLTCGSDVAQVSFMLRVPCFVFNDDDAAVVRFSALFGWPFASLLFAPRSCSMGFWKRKTIAYNGYQKLGYLHPNYFSPNRRIIEKYGLHNVPYFIIRSVSLTAHHDRNIRGLNNDLVKKLLPKLSAYGKVFISSEKKLPEDLQPYQLKINPLDIHHVLYYASLLIGDSQSMAHEAALLGTPSIRFNDFAGRIGVLEELEHKYNLTFGLSPDEPELLKKKAEALAKADNADFKVRAKKMMSEMIDLPQFIVWFIENYPKSLKIMRKNPDYQNTFK